MPTPIIDIAVNDAEFQRFAASFESYSAKLEEMPEAWQQLNEAISGAGDAGEALASGALSGKEALALAYAQAELIGQELTKAVKAQNALGDASHGTNKKMSDLAKTAKGLGSELAGVGKWVLKLGAGALAGLGLGAIVSGFGIGELANTLYQRARSAGGVGLSPGQLASFQSYGQQFLGENALHAAAAAQITYQSVAPLSMLGIDFNKANRMSTADLAFEELKGAIKNWQEAQKAGIAPEASPFVKAYQDLGGDLEDVRRAVLQGGIPAVSAAQAKYHAGAASMEYDARPWNEFKMQLDAAGRQIEATFGRALAPLVPEFTRLSIDVVNAFASFAKSKEFGVLIDDVKSGLVDFIKWIEGPDPKKLWEGLSLVAAEVMAVAEKLKWLVPEATPDMSKLPPEPGHAARGFGKPGELKLDALAGVYRDDKTGSIYDPLSNTWTDKNGNVYDPGSKTWKPTVGTQFSGALGSAWDWFKKAVHYHGSTPVQHSAHTPVNNPLDLTTGSDLGGLLFNQFATIDEGIRAGAKRLGQYPKDWGTKTLAAAIPLWSGLTNNPKAAAGYIGNVEKWSGVSRNEKITDFTRDQLAAVVAAMSRMEGTAVVTKEQAMKALYGSDHPTSKHHTDRIVKALGKRGTPAPVKVSVTNSTSSRVAVSANAIAAG